MCVTCLSLIACVRAGFHPSEARPSPFYLACLEASQRSNEKNKKSTSKIRELSLILYQYPVDSLINVSNFNKKVQMCLKMGNGLVGAISGAEHLDSKETRLFEGNENIFTLIHYFIYPCSCFDCVVTKSYKLKRKTASDV